MSFVDVLIYFVMPLLAVSYCFLKKKFSLFEDQGIPYIKPESWILGNLKGVGSSIHIIHFLQKLYDYAKDKDIVAGYFALFTPFYVPVDIDLIKQITVKDFSYFTDRGMYISDDEPLTGHLFALGGEKWKFIRGQLNSSFSSGNLKLMYHTVADKGVSLVKLLDNASKNGSLELKDIANRFTIDIVSSATFGMESNTLMNEHPELVAIFKKIFGVEGITTFRVSALGMAPKLAKLFRIRMFDKEVEDFFYDVVGGNIKNRERNNVVRNDFLNMLIQLKNNGTVDRDGSMKVRKFTYDETIAQAFIFFFAGADTSSTAISYTMTELGCNQNVQDRLRQEISEKTKTTHGEITYDNLHEMTYLNQVVFESLRRFPPIFATLRQAVKDYKIPNTKHVITKGSAILIPIFQIHHDERYWKDPHTFDPNRFAPMEVAKQPNPAFLGFGSGRRNCIGMRFALVNVKFAVATMVKHFRIRLDAEKTPKPIKFNPKSQLLSSVNGFWLHFEKISL